MVNRIEYAPIALFGSALGLTGLTLATLHVETITKSSHLAGGCLLSLTVMVLALVSFAYTIKLIRLPATVMADLNHPVRNNTFALLSGTVVLLGVAFLPFSRPIALPFWITGAVLQFAVMVLLVAKWIGPQVFDRAFVNPLMFLPAAGNVLVPLGGVAHGFIEVSWFFFSVGFVLWNVLLPILLGRLMTEPGLPDRFLPTLVILIAPPSLLMLAYLRLNPLDMGALPRVLYYTSLMFFFVICTQLPRFSRIAFSLSWWAYTFPFAAFTIATLTFADHFDLVPIMHFGTVLYVVLTGIVAAMFCRTVKAVVAGEIFVPEP
jgi:tellurite resistance protein